MSNKGESTERKLRRLELAREISEQIGKLSTIHDELSRLVDDLKEGAGVEEII
ncbi:MAG TPA: hypothetical protein VJ742_12370 [Nitrososphaera sp.]|nr:hypothetical protein [Nitrososphaera sp.]